MTNNYSLRSLTIFSLIIYLILVFTNNYYSVEEAAIIGLGDGVQYLKIIQASPEIPTENVENQQAYRFIIPYAIGALSHFTKVNDYYLLKTYIC